MTRSRETGDVGYRAYKKNLLRNGNFSVNQRNWSGPIPASGTRTLDGVIGYENTAAGDDISFNQRTSTAGDAAITNQPYDMQIDFVSSDAATSTVLFGQLIEDGVQITAGLDVSMSCKMFSAVVREISIEFIQNFGAGGSPQVRGITKKISLIAGWQDVAVTLAIPAITGKTLGDTPSLNALIWLSSGSNESANNDSLGLQPNGVVVMTSWQVEIGSSATSFEYVSPQENLAACQRYYEVKSGHGNGTYFDTGANFYCVLQYTKKRVEVCAVTLGDVTAYTVLSSALERAAISGGPANITSTSCEINLNTTTGTQGAGGFIRDTAGKTAILTIDAEIH